MQTLIKQPVKEAVREALAEDRASEAARTSSEQGRGTDRRGGSSSEGRGGSTLGRVLLLAVLAGAAYYAMQRRGTDIGSDLAEEVGVGGTDQGGPSVEDPLSPESEESTEGTSEDRTDEGPTTPS